MGNQHQYRESGGFSEYLYHSVSEPVYINGMRCRIIMDNTDKNGHYGGLPSYSNTSDVYVRLGVAGLPKQIRVYKDRKSYMDFDWGHKHTNADGTKFDKGFVHVQRYPGANGDSARWMTDSEHMQYDAIIKHFAPDAILYPRH